MTKNHNRPIINILPIIITILLILVYLPMILSAGHHRRILHQPLFPSVDGHSLPPFSQPPRQQPRQHPNYPFSFSSFFPLPLSPPPPSPPPPSSAAAVTFPADFSGHRSPPKPSSRKLLTVSLSVSLSAALLAAVAVAGIILRRKTSGRKFSSDKPSPESAPATSVSGEFLCLGTLRGAEENLYSSNAKINNNNNNSIFSKTTSYRRLSSPELHPIPPLPRQQPFSSESFFHEGDDDDNDEELFFSPNLSPNNNTKNNSSSNIKPSSSKEVVFREDGTNFRNTSGRSSVSSFPMDSMSSNSPFNIGFNLSPSSLVSNSPDSIERAFRAKPFSRNVFPSKTQDLFSERECLLTERENLSVPFPPPLPPPRFWEMFEARKGRHVATEDLERGEEESGLKPRLKPLHWDTLRASSEKAMVWDQIKSSSFQLNEEMIETLFMVNDPNSSSSENTRRLASAKLNQEYRVLDPKKSQNIAILLRALNVTVDEVCEALIEGTTDTLGTELLESLLKMTPSKDEERKLKESNDFSPTKLGPAEKFLKAILDIPFAFKRVDAMLYVANFDSEVEYLKKSFETLKAACEELKNNRMFRKLLDAVLQTGNRINLGTNRGCARAFKLDTLLKLVEIKGTDGKTTLLHFVVQEISQAEGFNLAKTNQDPTRGENKVELRKLGLCVVSRLSSELDNVKKAADTDLNMLSDEVARLSNGIVKIQDVMKVECGDRFSSSMNMFLNRAERELASVRSLYMECLCLVKAITEYFHGESGKEEARIFTVVRDFVKVLDCVCKEVGKVNERSFVGSGGKQPLAVNSSVFLFPQQQR